ncbi:MAG TPA: Smr/MutS family protein [Hanamia sp.]|nr:Smr/MutS family protein [Hanamia sp.]
MKYQPGDRVLILHSKEEAEVVEIINDQMVLVDVNGIRFPVYNDQIDFPYFHNFSSKKIVAPRKEKVYIDNLKKEEVSKKYNVHSGVWISFLPVFDKDIFDDDVVEKIKIYLINQTDESYDFLYQIKFKGSADFHLNNTVLPFKEFYLHDIPFEEMNDAPKFEFVFSLLQPNKKKVSHFETTFKIKAKQLFQKIEEMRLKNEPTFSFILFENYPDKIEEVIPDYNNSDGKLYEISNVKQKLEPARSVVDLHIEKLTDNWKGLSNFEILTIQLKNFEKFYQLAVAHRQPNLIVIHGIGTGKLRNEIHEILKTKKEVRTFANQYHHDFGFGATEIFFQY